MAGCVGTSGTEAPPDAVARAAYAPAGPPKLTLFTMINNTSGAGGHTALMVSGSQQVIFDPAGSFRDNGVVERGDVLYGMTPGWVQAYKSAHARSTYHVVTQEIIVTPAQAEQALQLVRTNGPVGAALCTSSTVDILRQIDGFPPVTSTLYPKRLMEQVETLPGVTTERYFEDDDGNLLDAIAAVQG